jgi:outer membrane lipoprotein carrier protein
VIARSLALFLMMPLAATAAGAARDRLDAFASGLAGLQGSFTQVVRDANGVLQEQSQGTVALRAPRQFRWEYQAPYPQLIVADGSNVWVHDLDLEQVTVRSQSAEESQSPLTVLTDLALLERDYRVSEAGESEGVAWLRLEPRAAEAPFERCDLGFEATQGLVSMRLHDSLGQRNEIRFADWARNPAFAADAFTFTVPEGADLIGEPIVAAQAFPIRD